MTEQVKGLNVEIDLEERSYKEVVRELIQAGDKHRLRASLRGKTCRI